MPYDIIGDIHGCYEELLELLEVLVYEQKNVTFIHPDGRNLAFVGDAADRGPESLAVWQFLFNLEDAKKLFYCPGNHCNKFYRYLKGSNVQITHGLETTVGEFKQLTKSRQEEFRKRFIAFYEKLPFYNRLDNEKLIIAHGGIREDRIG